MKKLLLGGMWVCVVTIAAVYVTSMSVEGASSPSEQPVLHGIDYVKTREISVPRVSEGRIQGYVVARFVFTIDAELKSNLSVPAEVFVVDEAFRTIYGDESIDFSNLRKTDLAALTKRITEGVNARLQPNLVHETLVDGFNYVPYETIGKRHPAPEAVEETRDVPGMIAPTGSTGHAQLVDSAAESGHSAAH